MYKHLIGVHTVKEKNEINSNKYIMPTIHKSIIKKPEWMFIG